MLLSVHWVQVVGSQNGDMTIVFNSNVYIEMRNLEHDKIRTLRTLKRGAYRLTFCHTGVMSLSLITILPVVTRITVL